MSRGRLWIQSHYEKEMFAIVHYLQASRDEAMAGVLEVAKSSVEVWRIENFEKVAWPKDLYGQFFGGDSFLGKKPGDHFVRYKSRSLYQDRLGTDTRKR